MTHKKLYFFLFSILSIGIFGQQKEKLQQQNADLKKQIATLNADLANSKKESRLSVAYLQNLNHKINLREKLYNNTQKEKRFIEDDIYKRQLEINKYNRELETLRKNYANILVKAYKNKGIQNKVTFILSSKNLGEALRRIQYLKQYSDFQDKKAAEITEKTNQIKATMALREKAKKEKEMLMLNQQNELKTINAEREQKEVLIGEFKQQEAKITAEIRQKQVESKQLEGEIRRIINEEIRIAKAKAEAERKAQEERQRLARIEAEREKARIEAENRAKAEALERERRAAEAEARKAAELAAKKAANEKRHAEEVAKAEANERAEARRLAAEKEAREAAAKAKAAEERASAARDAEARLAQAKYTAQRAAEDKVMKDYNTSIMPSSSAFADNRGRLPFPVRGQITHRFGRQSHPIFKNIQEDNSGIKIAVAPGTIAKAVFQGVVSKILYVGGSKTVMVRHGSYFTIYSNLSSVLVSQNQNVSAGTPIGKVEMDLDGSYTMEFQIWNGNTPVDPLGWLAY
ncbi:peptidoglycan DD-metalloendopeptidase family protein [Elizabethkingia argentiflava]|uniref:Peptidoglycan DD-metalloendopeptidase family protein n=1 Tax=Elizabethkingia argenteiflava TaxID=2681556 RepID=A0A845PWF6_9FLAO|nr:peptidoglycan DD-metalloendopeptidase family protein [Elizabethkingia argenteiflava]NAW51513.1 peptidoglycan DD-metalloendopeptidase family protein [Elizabethkingia argenteiflava]